MRVKKCLTFYSTYSFVGFTIVLLLGLIASGCGKRTFPQPIRQEPPPQINDLRANVLGKGVELTWTIPAQLKEPSQSSRYRLAVMKAEVAWDKRNCLECPAPEQELFVMVAPAHPEPAFIRGDKLGVIDNTISLEHAYRYQIQIQNEKGREVSLSNPVIVKVLPAPQPPADFSGLTENDGVLLKWKVPKKNANGQRLTQEPQFNIQRRLPNQPWESISPAPVKGNSFLDSAVAANETYDYRVFSILSFEGTLIWSEPSPVQPVKAPGALPPPPPDTVWAIPADGALEINWTPSEGKVAGYQVYRKQGKEIIRLTSEPVLKPPYVDRAVKPNVVYYYAVSAVGAEPPHPEGLLSKWAEIRSVKFQ